MVSNFRFKLMLVRMVAVATFSFLCVDIFAFSGAQTNAPIGALSTSGSVTLNGNKAISGASVFAGNSISTGADGTASVDLHALGRVIVRPSTTVTLTVVGQSLQISDAAEKVLVAGVSGSAQVDSAGGIRSLGAKEQDTFTGPVRISVAPGSVVVVEDMGKKKAVGDMRTAGKAAAGEVTVPIWGFLVLGGVAGGIAAGVTTHGGERNAAPSISPVIP